MGHVEGARNFARTIYRSFLETVVIDASLSHLGVNLTDLSVENKEFMTPRTLDAVIFEKFAPESLSEVETYLDRQGIAIVSSSDGVHNQGLFIALRKLGVAYSNLSQPFTYKGPKESGMSKIESVARSQRVEGYSVIFSNNPNIKLYLSMRHLARYGKIPSW